MNHLEQLHNRRKLFSEQLPPIENGASSQRKQKNTCPACGYPTLAERNAWNICGLCWWEDDGQDDSEADKVWGGPNGSYSLTEYRIAFHERFEQLSLESNNNDDIYRIINALKNAENTLQEGSLKIDNFILIFRKLISELESLPLPASQILMPTKQ